MAKREDELLDHNYDGIQEYDNDLPRWWVALFWGCIIFGVIYVGLYHFGGWKFTSQKLALEMENIKQLKEKTKNAESVEINSKENLLKLVSDKSALEAGKAQYEAKCAACHLPQGQGLVGPNLTDDYWIHGGEITDIRNIIEVGVVDKGMIAWGPLMKAEEINQVTAYIWSLHGTNPPNPKEPQGELKPRT